MPQFLAPLINDQQIDSNGDPLNGGTIEIYLAGSSTAVASYSDQAGLVPNTWPLTLNTLGLNSQGAIWLPGGTAYKYVIKDAIGLVQRTIDNVSGINDTTVTLDQWIPYAGPPTYVNATSFTVVGDQTPTFQVGRRLKSTNTSGTIYSTIITSVYSAPNTTVTVSNDSGVLDSGLSQVSYGLISPTSSSAPPSRPVGFTAITANGNFTVPQNVFALDVEVWGGGGGSGGVGGPTNGSASGGGAGGYARGVIPVVPGQVIACVIGAAGTAGAAGGTGGSGGTTGFGGFLGGNGGGGGTANTIGSGGVGGNGSGGSLQLSGGGGAGGLTTGLSGAGGSGGASPFGGAGGNGSIGTGAPGNIPGGGGGAPGSAAAQAGTAGARGQINIRY